MHVKIFIVDDDWFSRKLYHQHLLNLGFSDVHLFDNGDDCLKVLTNQQPDIIFLDYNMQPIDGLEMMKIIKSLYPKIYVLMISGHSDVQVAIKALKHGAFDYIIKDENEVENLRKITNNIVLLMKPVPRFHTSYHSKSA